MAPSALNYDPTRRYDFKVEDVEYRHDSDQSWLAMVYQPQGNGPFPALIDIHGGAWNNGDRTNNPAIAPPRRSRSTPERPAAFGRRPTKASTSGSD